MNHTVLFVDDEANVLCSLTRVMHKEPYRILMAGSAEEAAAILNTEPVDLVVTDEQMPGMPGSEFLALVARDHPDTVRIVLTGRPSLPGALRAINEGKIYQFLTKPCNEIDLVVTIRRALEERDLLAKSRDLLEVTRRQSILIDEARRLRRLNDLPREERTSTIDSGGPPMDRREILEAIDEEVRRGQDLLHF